MKKDIYIVNKNRHHFDAIEKIKDRGDVYVLTEGTVNVFMVDQIEEEMEKKLKNFKQSDYLLLSGSSILNILAVNILLRRYNYIDVLIYHIKKNIYIARRIER